MILSRAELLSSLNHEVRILQHLAGKIDRTKLDYRPTPKQRSTLELVQYLSVMGPNLFEVAKTGKFDPPAWTALERAAFARDFDQTLAAIAEHPALYEKGLARISDDEMRTEINPFGQPFSRGAFLVNLVLGGCAAYRTQLFCYLKACGRDELSTINLWAGMDAPVRQ